MSNPEGSPWSKTDAFLRRFGVRVDLNSKGTDNFNQLECKSSGNLLELSICIGEAAARAILSFTGQPEQGIVIASAVLVVASSDQLVDLLRRNAYMAYAPKGSVRIGRITAIKLQTNTLVLVPGNERRPAGSINRITFTPKSGALISMANNIYGKPGEYFFTTHSRFIK